jgi:hypothetical protein
MDYVTVYDGRNAQAPLRTRYDWPAAVIIEACNEAPKSRDQIRTMLADVPARRPVTDEDLTAALDRLTAARILYEERGKYFTLAIPEYPFL